MRENISKEKYEFRGIIWVHGQYEHYWYGYDQVSAAVYRINKKTYVADLFFNPDELQKIGVSVIRDLKIVGDDMVMIPPDTNKSWVVFNLQTQEIKRGYAASKCIYFDCVHEYDHKFYVMPMYTDEPILVFDENYNYEREINGWYKGERTTCYVSSCDKKEMLIPIHHTDCAIRMKANGNVEEIHCQDVDDIYMLVGVGEMLYALPHDGEMILLLDRNGNCIKKIPVIDDDGNHICVKEFVRIVPIEKGILLFPITGKSIYLWKKGDAAFYQIKVCSEMSAENYSLVDEGNYWDYVDLGNEVHLFPGRYRYAVVNPNKREMRFYGLQCGEGFSKDDYIRWKKDVLIRKGNIIKESSPRSLEEFLEII